MIIQQEVSSNEIEGVKYFNLDIEEIETINDTDFDICFHLAAQSRVQPSFDNPRNQLE
jgi:GDP-D-mannose dehydratase